MAHYRNGREAKVGDQVVYKTANGLARGGMIATISATAITCNATVAPTYVTEYVTLSDCMHADDTMTVFDKTGAQLMDEDS